MFQVCRILTTNFICEIFKVIFFDLCYIIFILSTGSNPAPYIKPCVYIFIHLPQVEHQILLFQHPRLLTPNQSDQGFGLLLGAVLLLLSPTSSFSHFVIHTCGFRSHVGFFVCPCL